MRADVVKFVFLIIALCEGQVQIPTETEIPEPAAPTSTQRLHNGLTEKIGNFSLELLYHTSQAQPKWANLIISPITVWTVLAVTAEGARGNTLAQINNAIRTRARNRDSTRAEFGSIVQWLQNKTATVDLAKVNALFVDDARLPLQDFKDTAKRFYDTDVVALNFKKPAEAANLVNSVISNVTRGKIPKLISSDTFLNSQMVLTSALYFKGQWTLPFNATNTVKTPFLDSDGKTIREVNMMHNVQKFPLANLQQLQASIIELPYGNENRLSMLIMLPYPGVSLENMFLNFGNTTLDTVFEEIRISREEYGGTEVHCYIPRFKIESELDMTSILKDRLGIQDLFDADKANLPYMARTPLYVSKITHKAVIEVTEEGTVATGVTVEEISDRFGDVEFEANRPFTFMIVERNTNSIVFGGFYQEPSLY